MKKILCASVLIVALVCVKASCSNDDYSEWLNTRAVKTVMVHSGDTLDGFGYQYKPDWMDVRQYRRAVMTLNNMDSATIYSGQSLKVYVCTEQYTVQGWCWEDTITTVDGNMWGYDNDTNGCAYVTFSDNGTVNNIYDDVIMSVEYIE